LVNLKKDVPPDPNPQEVDLGVHDGTRNKIKQIKGASREASLGHWASHAAGKKPARSVR